MLIIATDGESSDGSLAAAMKPLEQLPVSVVVRLCTNDDKVYTSGMIPPLPSLTSDVTHL